MKSICSMAFRTNTNHEIYNRGGARAEEGMYDKIIFAIPGGNIKCNRVGCRYMVNRTIINSVRACLPCGIKKESGGGVAMNNHLVIGYRNTCRICGNNSAHMNSHGLGLDETGNSKTKYKR